MINRLIDRELRERELKPFKRSIIVIVIVLHFKSLRSSEREKNEVRRNLKEIEVVASFFFSSNFSLSFFLSMVYYIIIIFFKSINVLI